MTTDLHDALREALADYASSTAHYYDRIHLDLIRWASHRDLDVLDLDSIHLSRFLAEASVGLSTATTRRALSAIRFIYRTARHTGLCDDDPAFWLQGPPNQPTAQAIPEPLATSQIAQLRSAADSLGPHHVLAICMPLEAGLRPIQVARLRPLDVRCHTSHRESIYILAPRGFPVPLGDQAATAVVTLSERIDVDMPLLGPRASDSTQTKRVTRLVNEVAEAGGTDFLDLSTALRFSHALRYL